MPRTGGAFLVGAMAIAGLPPLNGFASEWLTLQSLLAVPANGGVAAGSRARSRSAALAATAALAVLCFVKVVGLVLLGRPRRARIEEAVEAPVPMWSGGRRSSPSPASSSGSSPASSPVRSPDSRPGRRTTRRAASVEVPWDDTLPAPGIFLVLLAGTALLAVARGRRRAATGAELGLRAARRARAPWTSAGFTKPLRLVLEAVLRPTRDISQSVRGGVLQEVRYEGHVPHLFDTHLNRPITRVGLWAAARARRLQSGSLTAYVAYLVALVHRAPRRGAHGADRVSGASVAAAVQLVGGLALAPLLPGLVQHWKARLQGRRGPSPLQPYRELARLWSRASIEVGRDDARLPRSPRPSRPLRVLAAVLLVPVGGDCAGARRRSQLLALGGLLALARFAVCAAAWDTENGFALMGASRDLTVSVFTEAALVLSLAVARSSPARPTSRASSPGRPEATVWTSPGLALGAVGFALVVLAETGRQPFDNPDTHLELTMIHEGPVLEYGGRDLALPAVGAAARHWIVLVLAAQIFVPHARERVAAARAPAGRRSSCSAAALALVETLVAKMRILLAPRLLAVGAAPRCSASSPG